MMNLPSFLKRIRPTQAPEHVPAQPQEYEWELFSKTYSPPVRNVQQIAALEDKQIFQRAFFGFTTYIWRDAISGETRREEILGAEDTQLEALIRKVNVDGMQYIEVGGETYAITKWVMATQEPTE